MTRSHHGRVLALSVAARRQEVLESLATGHDKKTYWRLVGQLQGLDDALKLSDDADKALNGDDTDGDS